MHGHALRAKSGSDLMSACSALATPSHRVSLVAGGPPAGGGGGAPSGDAPARRVVGGVGSRGAVSKRARFSASALRDATGAVLGDRDPAQGAALAVAALAKLTELEGQPVPAQGQVQQQGQLQQLQIAPFTESVRASGPYFQFKYGPPARTY